VLVPLVAQECYEPLLNWVIAFLSGYTNPRVNKMAGLEPCEKLLAMLMGESTAGVTKQ